jgi:hypothetical protein
VEVLWSGRPGNILGEKKHSQRRDDQLVVKFVHERMRERNLLGRGKEGSGEVVVGASGLKKECEDKERTDASPFTPAPIAHHSGERGPISSSRREVVPGLDRRQHQWLRATGVLERHCGPFMDPSEQSEVQQYDPQCPC